MTIEYCRQQQRECADKLVDEWDSFTALGLFDWFAEEFLMEYES